MMPNSSILSIMAVAEEYPSFLFRCNSEAVANPMSITRSAHSLNSLGSIDVSLMFASLIEATNILHETKTNTLAMKNKFNFIFDDVSYVYDDMYIFGGMKAIIPEPIMNPNLPKR